MSKPNLYDEESFAESDRAPTNATRQSGPALVWDNLVYTVKSAKKGDTRTILSGITGHVCPGEMVALIGSSGAGKTTLLNTLAGRLEGGKLAGSVTYLGAKRNPRVFKRITAYVQQEDVMHGRLTVFETLSYASKLRMSNSSYSAQEKAQRVETVIRQLRLEGARNTKIGDQNTRGVSGGEKKRVSIGTELLADPRLLLLDEPTSGLDSNSSEMVVELVKSVTRERGLCTLVTIHQPNARIFNMFDKVILLSQGQVIYFGPASTAIQYFTDIGHPCPMHENPADFFVDLMTLDYRSPELLDASKRRIADLSAKFESYAAERSEKSSKYGAESIAHDSESVVRRNNWVYEFSVLVRREWVNMLRNVPFIAGQIIQSVFMAVFIGFMFFYLGSDQEDVQNRLGVLFIVTINATFPVVMPLLAMHLDERSTMVRERSAATFRVSSYFVSKVFTYYPLIMVTSTIYYTGLYFVSRLSLDAAKYFTGFGINLVMNFVAIGFVLLVGSLVKTMDVGAIIAPSIMMIQLLYGGILANLNTVTPVLNWIRWANPVYYTFSAFTQNEFKGLTFECNFGGLCYSSGDQVLGMYGLNRFSVWQCVLFILAIAAVNYFIAYAILRWKAKPRYVWV